MYTVVQCLLFCTFTIGASAYEAMRKHTCNQSTEHKRNVVRNPNW